MTTSTSSSTSISGGTISSVGIGSGLDVNSIISGLMQAENVPLTNLQTQATSIKATISAFGEIQSALSSFQTAASALALPSTWNATTGTSADPTSVSVATTANATAGNYAVQVQTLAAAQSTVSGTFSSGAALVGAGTLHVDLGAWSGTPPSSFTAQTGSSGMDITVSATDTLSTLASKINSARAGINASVVTDTSGSRLVFSSTNTGTTNGFRVSVANDNGSGLAALAYDPANGSAGTSLTQAGVNAAATINGLSINSASNTLSNVISGMTLTLSKVTSAPIQISVAQDTAAVTQSVQTFVSSYNALASLLNTDLKYDASTSTAGPLQADSAAVTLQRQLRAMIGSPTTAPGAFSTLSQIGMAVQTDGTLQLDTTKFTTALASPSDLKSLFTNVDLNNPNNNGIGTKLRTLCNSIMGSDGLLTSRIKGLNTSLTSNQKNQSDLSVRLAATQARLTAQYSALDSQMSSINALSTYVTQQIANWNKPAS